MLHRIPRRRPVTSQLGEVLPYRTVPAPLGGWNARDSIDAMPANDAVRLDNWFPQIGKVVSRPGYTEHSDTTTAAAVDKLMQYEVAGSQDLLAVSDGKVYDVTTASPSTLATGLTAAAGPSTIDVQFGDRLIFCNGTDNAKSYNGSTVADAAHTGLTLTDWAYVHLHNERLYVAEKNTASFWYSGTGASASGTLTEYDLSLVGLFRGNLEIICSISRDGGAGPDDYICFISDHGDVLVYSGTNPGDANNWSKVGEYRIGRPLGRRASTPAGADVYILTDRGYESLTTSMTKGAEMDFDTLPSYKIQTAVLARINSIGHSDKWHCSIYPLGQMMIVNVPRSATLTEQHVRNINTGAWCRFHIPAESWIYTGLGMYFGGRDGKVYRFDNAAVTDDGTAIACDGQTAWNNLGRRGINKKLVFIKQALGFSLRPAVRTRIGVDYENVQAPTQVTIPADTTSASVWDVAVWDVATWAAAGRTEQYKYKANGFGDAFSQRFQVDASLAVLEWGAAQYFYEIGDKL